MLFVQFSGALSTTAAQNLAAYTVFSGKTKKVHKVSQILYNKLVPLTEAVYDASADTVILVPRGKHALPKLEQLQVNVSVLTDPVGRADQQRQELQGYADQYGACHFGRRQRPLRGNRISVGVRR